MTDNVVLAQHMKVCPVNESTLFFNPLNANYTTGPFHSTLQGSRKTSLVLGVMWVIILVFNLLLLISNIGSLNATDAEFRNALETEGAVTECTYPTPIFNIINVSYTYTLTNVDGSQTVYRGFDEVNALCIRESDTARIQVLYLPDNPSISRAAVGGNAGMRLGISLRGITVAFYALAAIVSLSQYRNATRSIKQLEQKGRIIPGSISGYGRRIAWLPQRYTVAHYQFTNDVGKVLKGRQALLLKHLEGKALPPLGTPIAVLYVDDKIYQVL